MQLSVIIPVFRVEATLRRCVESVLAALPAESEVVLVDDGSDDHCPALCDEWAVRDDRIRVVHRPNGGLSAARNSGIEVARGTWLTFVDSDDWVAADTYGPLMQELAEHPECDLVEFPAQVYEGGREERRLVLTPGEWTSAEDYWLTMRGYAHAYAWNKIYRRTLFGDKVRYPEGRLFEDVPTTWRLIQRARRIRLSTHGLYHYMANPQGITLTAGCSALGDLLAAQVDIFKQLRRHRLMDLPMQRYYLHIVNTQIDVFRLGQPYLLLPTEPIGWNCLTDRELPWSSRLKAAVIKFFSLKQLCQLQQTIHNIRQGRF